MRKFCPLPLLRLLCLTVLIIAASITSFAGSIVGPWYLTNAGQAQSTVVFIFLADGRFIELEDGNPISDPSGQDGLEKGLYTWNPTTGAFAVNVQINTNGQWGFSDGNLSGATVSATDSVLTLSVPGEGSFPADRLTDPASAIVGAWYVSTGPNAQDLTVVAFLPNGKVMIGIDPPMTAYFELGTYTWDPLTGAFNATIGQSDAPPGSSLNLSSFNQASIVNGSLALSSTAGNLTLADTALPEPGTLALLAAGLAGVFLRRSARLNS